MVPMFTCGLLRSNFSFAIACSAPQIKVCLLANSKNLCNCSNFLRTHVPALILLDDFLADRIRRFGVMRKVHGEIGAALSAAAQIGGVTEHLRQGNFRPDYVGSGAVFRTLNRGTPRVEVAVNGGHVFFGNDHFDAHDGLEQNRGSFVAGFLEGHGTGNFKGHFRAVHIVVAAVDEHGGDIHHGEAGQNSIVERFANAGFDRGDELARDRAANNLVDKEEAVFLVELPLAGRAAHNFFGQRVELVGGHIFHIFTAGAGDRMQLDLAVAVLTTSAGLLDVFAFGGSLFANGFAIGHLRASDVGLHVVFAQHAVDDNFEMQLAHSGNQRLPGVGLGGNAESRVFLRQALHGHTQLVLVGLGFRFDGYGNYRSGKIDVLEHDRLVFVAQRVAGVDALQTDAGTNVAGVDGIDFFTLVGVHLQQAADALAGGFAGVVNVAAGFQNSGINADVGDMADERIGHNFEGQRGKRSVVGRAAQFHFFGIRIGAFQRRHVHR